MVSNIYQKNETQKKFIQFGMKTPPVRSAPC